MDASLRLLVWRRAGSRCEYCGLSQKFDPVGFEIEHIIPLKHQGSSEDSNLALSCFGCNRHKGPNLAGVDSETGAMTRLFHPRLDFWPDHFRWEGARLIGTTDVGRTTIDVLNINAPLRAAHREALIEEGVFPTTKT